MGAFQWTGGVDVVLSADKLHIVPLAAAILGYAVWQAWIGKWGNVEWIGERFPYLALVFVGYSVLLSVYHDAQVPMGVAVAKALVATTVCFASFMWLDGMRRICERKVPIAPTPIDNSPPS